MRKITAVFFAFILPSLAFAQSDAAEQEARERFKEGKALYAQNKIEEARLKFVQACAVLKDDVCVRNLAIAEFYSNHYVDAYRHITDLLAHGSLKSEPDIQREFERMQQEAYSKTGHIDVQAPPGGQIRVDDAIDAGNAPLKELVHVAEGKHVVSVQVETHIEREEIDCAAGKVVKVDFNQKFHFTTGPSAGEEQKKMFPPPTGALVLGGLGVVGLGLGIGFAAVSSSQNDENTKRALMANGVCSTQPTAQICIDARSTRDAQQTSALVATIGVIGGSAMIAGAVVWWLVAPRRVRSTPAQGLTPVIAPSFAGASWSTTF